MPLGLQNFSMTLYVLTTFIYLWFQAYLQNCIILDLSTIGLEFEYLPSIYRTYTHSTIWS